MEIIIGDLLTASETYIVQQCCCTACRPHGLSKSIADTFPHGNLYSMRKPVAPRRNTARSEDRATPGTCILLGDGKEKRFIACLMAQYAMGKPGKYESFGVPDSTNDRELYFKQSLDHFASQIPDHSSIAFPYKIGCGLAGGSWVKYRNILEDWSKQHPSYRIRLYRFD
jgi:hypothetical protein